MQGESEGCQSWKAIFSRGIIAGRGGRKGKKVFWAADQNAKYFYSNEGGVGEGGG